VRRRESALVPASAQATDGIRACTAVRMAAAPPAARDLASPPSPPSPPAAPSPPELGHILDRNVQALLEARRCFNARRSREQRVADAITRFTGSMPFVYLHAAVFGGWLIFNLGVIPRVRPWDPFPFVMLAMIASVEAIFLSTFVLISQNRMGALADQRADLDVQINLLTEHEVTKLIATVSAIAGKLGIDERVRTELRPLEQDVKPEHVIDHIAAAADDAKER
jgi:uncharacterized membrane protein